MSAFITENVECGNCKNKYEIEYYSDEKSVDPCICAYCGSNNIFTHIVDVNYIDGE